MSQELAIRQPEEPQERAIVNYENISAKPLSQDQQSKIPTEPPLEWVKKRPDGMVYVDGVHYREVLDKIFGVAGWALRPINTHGEQGEMSTQNGKKRICRVFVQGQLWAEGRFISESVGEDVYYLDNNNDSYATAWEKAKSNLLVRCCKELGLFRAMWNKDWIEANKAQFGKATQQQSGKPAITLRKQDEVKAPHETTKPTPHEVAVKSCETLEEVLKKNSVQLKSSQVPGLRKKYTGVADLTVAPLPKVMEYLNILTAKRNEAEGIRAN